MFILCLDVFVLSLNTEVPFYLFFNRHILSKWMGLDVLIAWISMFFPLFTYCSLISLYYPGLIDSLKIASGLLNSCVSSSRILG